MYKFFNPNPHHLEVDDCVIRGISKVTGQSWDDTSIGVFIQSFIDKNMPSSNSVWNNYLIGMGYKRYIIPDTCPDCYTVCDFCADNPRGTFLLATGSHVVAVVDGDYYDTWDSGDCVPIYFYTLEV